MNDGFGWLYARRSRVLLGASLAMSLVLGAGFVAVNEPPPEAPALWGAALSDEQAAAQVVDSAREIVAAAQLRGATGGYTFMSCSSVDGPPYQAVLYMNFPLPQANSAAYLDDVTSAMRRRGWTPSAAIAEHFGHKLTRNGLTSELNRTIEDRGFASVRLYGECRNTTEHRDDNPAWIEVNL